MKTINLKDELIAANRRVLSKDQAVLDKQTALDRETDKLVERVLDSATATVEKEKAALLTILGMSYKLKESDDLNKTRKEWAHLPQERIFSKDAIKAVCIKYNLRFLPTSMYKGTLDAGISDKVDELMALNGGSLPGHVARKPVPTHPQTLPELQAFLHAMSILPVFGDSVFGTTGGVGSFQIAAPVESFELQERPVDPLLFCSLGNDQYFLVHKWGSDLSISRSLHKHMGWMRKLVCVLSVFAVMPLTIWFRKEHTSETEMWFTVLDVVLFTCIAISAWSFLIPKAQPTSSESSWNNPFKS